MVFTDQYTVLVIRYAKGLWIYAIQDSFSQAANLILHLSMVYWQAIRYKLTSVVFTADGYISATIFLSSCKLL